jgi:hypothetical protein
MYSLAFVGLLYANIHILAYWLHGTFFGVLDSAIRPDAFHYDWIGSTFTSSERLRQQLEVLEVCTSSLSFHKRPYHYVVCLIGPRTSQP